MIKVGQIGIGHNHGKGKMNAIRKLPELFEVVGYAESDEMWIAKRGNLPPYQDLPRMDEDELIEKCDLLLVETDVWNLTKTAKKCLLAGKHIHMDKPASGTLEEFREILDIAKEKKLVVQLGYMYRYNPGVKHAHTCLREGKFGEITSINAEMSTSHLPEYREWLRHFPGGIMYILGCHLIDLCLLFLGEPKAVHSFLKHTQADGVDVADNNLAILEYDRALARVFVSSVEINGYGRRQFVVAGTKATMAIQPMENPILATWSDKEMVSQGKPHRDCHVPLEFQDLDGSDRYKEMCEDLAAFVNGEKENPYTYEHEYLLQKVLLEVCKSEIK